MRECERADETTRNTPPALVDTVVLGGGVAGLGVARALAVRRRRHVVVLPGSASRAGATLMSAGTYCVAGKEGSLERHLTGGSRRVFKEMEAEGLDLGRDECGALELAVTQEQAEFLGRTAGDSGGGVLLRDARDIAALEPALGAGGVKAALWFPLAGVIDPLLLVLGLQESVARHGGEVWEDDEAVYVSERVALYPFLCRATYPEEDERFCFARDVEERAPLHHAFLVRTAKGGEFVATNVVVCGGVWTQDVLERVMGLSLRLPPHEDRLVVPVRAQGMLVRGLALRRVLFFSEVYCRGLHHTHSEHARRRLAHHTYGRPAAASAGGGDDDVAFWGFDRVPVTTTTTTTTSSNLTQQAAENLAYLRQLLPQLSPRIEDMDVGSWVCHMPFGWHDEPIVGELCPGVFVLSGLGPRGIERGPQLAEDLVVGSMLGGGGPLDEASHAVLARFGVRAAAVRVS